LAFSEHYWSILGARDAERVFSSQQFPRCVNVRQRVAENAKKWQLAASSSLHLLSQGCALASQKIFSA
jgi:hypothetical protein